MCHARFLGCVSYPFHATYRLCQSKSRCTIALGVADVLYSNTSLGLIPLPPLLITLWCLEIVIVLLSRGSTLLACLVPPFHLLSSLWPYFVDCHVIERWFLFLYVVVPFVLQRMRRPNVFLLFSCTLMRHEETEQDTCGTVGTGLNSVMRREVHHSSSSSSLSCSCKNWEAQRRQHTRAI